MHKLTVKAGALHHCQPDLPHTFECGKSWTSAVLGQKQSPHNAQKMQNLVHVSATSGSSFSTLPHRSHQLHRGGPPQGRGGRHERGSRLGMGFASCFGYDCLRKGGNMSSALCHWSTFGSKKSSSTKPQLLMVRRSFRSHLSPSTSTSHDEVR